MNADETSEEIVDIFTHSHIEGAYKINNHLSVSGSVILEGDPAGHAHGGGAARTGDRFFDDHPLYIEKLSINYDDDYMGAYAGKFTPRIGLDAHNVPGWWGMLVFEEFNYAIKSVLVDIFKMKTQHLNITNWMYQHFLPIQHS